MLAIKEIRAIVEDCRSNTIGGLKVRLDIWGSAYIPSLLNNSSTWMEIDDLTLNKLEEMQNTLYRSLLSVPHTTPKAALTWEVGGMMMKFRIMMNKLIFVNHIMNLDDNTLAKQVLSTQIAQDLPGLKYEAEFFIADLGLPNLYMKTDTKERDVKFDACLFLPLLQNLLTCCTVVICFK